MHTCICVSVALSLSAECRARDLFPPGIPYPLHHVGGGQGSEHSYAAPVSSRHLKGRCPSCPLSPRPCLPWEKRQCRALEDLESACGPLLSWMGLAEPLGPCGESELLGFLRHQEQLLRHLSWVPLEAGKTDAISRVAPWSSIGS